MSPVNVYDRPDSADRSPYWKIAAGVIIALIALTLAGWALFYNNVDVEDHKTVEDHTIEVDPGVEVDPVIE